MSRKHNGPSFIELGSPMPSCHRLRKASQVVARLVGVAVLLVVLASITSGRAFGVVRGKTVSITAAPWTVVVWEAKHAHGPKYAACTGVIIDPRHVLTAGHCAVVGESAGPMPPSEFRIEAGVSNFKHPLASDHPQFGAVRVVRVMPGYLVATTVDAVAHDLAVLTLSRPLDLRGDDPRAAYLPSTKTPEPSRKSRLVIAGFGNEKPKAGIAYANGTLNEADKPVVLRNCRGDQSLCFVWGNCRDNQVLCVSLTTSACWGDSGLGAVEPGRRPTVVGIFSEALTNCMPGPDAFVALTAPAVLRFIRTST
jgi:secreted trypsin-like serine protease